MKEMSRKTHKKGKKWHVRVSFLLTKLIRAKIRISEYYLSSELISFYVGQSIIDIVISNISNNIEG